MSRLQLRTEVVEWRRLEDEIVVLDLASSVYLSIRGVGAVLWEALAEGATQEELTALVVDGFEVDPETATADVAAYLADLRSRSLVEPAA